MRTDKFALSGLIICLSLGGLALTGAGCAGDRYHRSTGAYLDDKSINTRVKTALFSDPQVSGFDVHVNSFRGDVQLSGFVDTPEQKERAAQVAREIEGVRVVTNNLELKSGANAMGRPAPELSGSSGTITQPIPEQPPADQSGSVAPVRSSDDPLNQSSVSSPSPSISSQSNVSPSNLDQNTPGENPTSSSAIRSSSLPPDTRLLPSFHIDVVKGQATLRGTVDSDVEKRDIERRMQNMPGIQSVDNQLEVQSSR
jgi:hyperosmotically inducible periplasmic protein